ncbi:MAG: GntG family PLP-dependent aldolase [Candidatus Lernaella stagnicola]|nr:GntG family PLP-dependent aldolase [Candidatus Lernaella stagnicola]
MSLRVDLRSDTVTKPGPDMLQAMIEAEVGDDVLGDDPTTKKLEEKTAAMLGTEAALFFPSGTMSNQTAIEVQTAPGDEIICDVGAHLYVYESGGPAFIAHVSVCTIEGHHGIITAPMIEKRIRPDNIHAPQTRLICLENTHNRAGGRVFPVETMAEVGRLAAEHGLRIHLDGARIWNAAVARGIPVTEWTQWADTINVCLSKGLGAPIGSLLAGDEETIARARWTRKRLGGGMRQVGLMAGAGLYALEYHIPRLADDHANARALAEGLNGLPGLNVRPGETDTNIVMIDLTEDCRFTGPELQALLTEYDVHVIAMSPGRIRAVTHLDVDRAGIDRAVEVFAGLLEQ